MHNYFCGWYFKCQSDTQTLAAIPAIHRSGSRSSCSIQLITDDNAWNICFPYHAFRKRSRSLCVDIRKNHFGTDGIVLDIKSAGVRVSGSVSFSGLSPIRYDIMGPFSCVPFMECRHSIVSMSHRVNGKITVNGTCYSFDNAAGYIEGDRGRSFPGEYAWTHCCFEGGSLMLSVADIPIGRLHFTGIIAVIHFRGKEYRLATYLGARLLRLRDGEIIIKQGSMVFSARLMEKSRQPLSAPVNGSMSRTIHESASCRAAYRFEYKGQTVFDFESRRASFEYEYPLGLDGLKHSSPRADGPKHSSPRPNRSEVFSFGPDRSRS